jgi:uncharacterized membrane protein YbhN (UPF0104 family)
VRKWLRLLVSAALLGWLAWRTDWRHVGELFAGLRLGYWLAAVGLYVGTQVVSSWRWRMLARPLGFERPLRQYVAFYFLGMFFNLFLPTSVGGDVLRAWYLDGGAGRRGKALVSVLLDRLSGLVVLLVLACVAVVGSPVALPLWIRLSVWGVAGCALLGLFLLPWVARRHRLLAEVRRCGAAVLRPGPLGLSVLVQSANVALVWLVGLGLGAPVPGAYYWILVPMVTLLTLLPVSLNGMGIREGATVVFLAPLGVPEGTAVSLALLWFLVFTAAGLIGGGVYLCGPWPRFQGRTEHEPVGGHPDQGRARQPRAAA